MVALLFLFYFLIYRIIYIYTVIYIYINNGIVLFIYIYVLDTVHAL